jgi:Glu-tRNA(Gln) amidotransferase subunit E-like FAD-binding protein
MDSLKLINPEFDFEFAGTTYKVRKATLDKIILFQTRFNQLTEAKDPAVESKMTAYCLYLILKDIKADVTEEWVAQNTPQVEMVDVVEQFAFMNQQKVDVLRKILQRNALVTKEEPTGIQSSQ